MKNFLLGSAFLACVLSAVWIENGGGKTHDAQIASEFKEIFEWIFFD
jgi:hypothetical protein